jgi:hypothetical protein
MRGKAAGVEKIPTTIETEGPELQGESGILTFGIACCAGAILLVLGIALAAI